jgi:hypothetical protein
MVKDSKPKDLEQTLQATTRITKCCMSNGLLGASTTHNTYRKRCSYDCGVRTQNMRGGKPIKGTCRDLTSNHVQLPCEGLPTSLNISHHVE